MTSAAYSDTGVPWLGEVPTQWKLLQTRRVCKLTTGGRDTQDADPNGEYPFFVRSQTVERIDTYSFDGEAVLTSGDGAGVGKIFHHHIGKLEFHQRVYLYYAFRHVVGRFFFYYLRETLHRVVLAGNAKSTVDSLRRPMLQEFPVVVPPLAEQHAIVSFLDRKTAAIDALIAKKERLIELLQEKQQALITQAVTKGLDPTVPMKDSGVEWLGTIPAHWTLRRLKHLGQIRSGIAKGRDVAGKETSALPYLRVANVQNGWLDLEDIATIEVTREEARRYALHPGDVLMNEGGDFDKLGRGYVWQGQISDCIHQNHVFAVRPWRTVNPYWVNLATQASYLRHFFILRSKQSTNLASISSTNLGEAPIPMPPEAEVEAILDQIRARLVKVDSLVRAVSSHIEKLREYRQALITAAVTGKIDVSKEAA